MKEVLKLRRQVGVNKLYDRYSEMETLLEEIMDEKQELEVQNGDLVEKCRAKDELVPIFIKLFAELISSN